MLCVYLTNSILTLYVYTRSHLFVIPVVFVVDRHLYLYRCIYRDKCHRKPQIKYDTRRLTAPGLMA